MKYLKHTAYQRQLNQTAAITDFRDEDLLALLRTNDKLAFAELYNRYHVRVYRYLEGIVKVPEQAEDLVHEVFLKLWEVREKLNVQRDFSSYLFRMCHNKACDVLRKTANDRNLRSKLLHYYETGVDIPEWSTADLHRYDNLVEEALNELTPARRKVYELCKKQGKSYAEAAHELNVSMNTVKDHMKFTLAQLRQFVQKHSGGEKIYQ